MTWNPVTLNCLGGALIDSAAIWYLIPVWVGSMAFDTAICPLDEFGRPQACAIWTYGEDSTALTEWAVPTPPVGSVVMYRDPVAVTMSAERGLLRSDGPCP